MFAIAINSLYEFHSNDLCLIISANRQRSKWASVVYSPACSVQSKGDNFSSCLWTSGASQFSFKSWKNYWQSKGSLCFILLSKNLKLICFFLSFQNFTQDYTSTSFDHVFSGSEKEKLLNQVICQHMYRHGLLEIGEELARVGHMLVNKFLWFCYLIELSYLF